MAGRPRRTPVEKIQEEIDKIQVSINQHRDEIEELKARERALKEQMKEAQLKEISLIALSVMEEKNMSASELKDMLANKK